MFLAIPQISSAYTDFTEVEATEATTAFSKHVLLTLINPILSIPNSKSQAGKKFPPAPKTLKSPRTPPEVQPELVISALTTRDVLPAQITHLESGFKNGSSTTSSERMSRQER